MFSVKFNVVVSVLLVFNVMFSSFKVFYIVAVVPIANVYAMFSN